MDLFDPHFYIHALVFGMKVLKATCTYSHTKRKEDFGSCLGIEPRTSCAVGHAVTNCTNPCSLRYITVRKEVHFQMFKM